MFGNTKHKPVKVTEQYLAEAKARMAEADAQREREKAEEHRDRLERAGEQQQPQPWRAINWHG